MGLAIHAGDAGQKLQAYSNLTGASISVLQDWQYALEKAGVTADETTSSMTQLFETWSAANLQSGNLPQAWVAQLASLANAGTNELQEAIRNPDKSKFMEILRRAAQNKTIDAASKATMLKSMGLSTNVIQGLESKDLANPVGSAPAWYKRSAETAQNLQKMRVEITRLGQELERKFDSFLVNNFSSIRGMLDSLIQQLPMVLATITPMIPQLTQLTTTILKLVSGLFELANNVGVFKLITTALEGLNNLAQWLGFLSDKHNVAKPTETSKYIAPQGKFEESMIGKAWGMLSGKNNKDAAAGNTTNITQHITAPDPLAAGKHAAAGVKDVITKRDLNNAHRSNSTLNQVN